VIVPRELSEIYDEFAEDYEQNRGLFDMSAVLESFYRCLGSDKGRLLDLGCGAGEPFARWFIDRGWEVTGVDFSSRMLALAARYVPEMKTFQADMRDVEFGAGEFDAITAIYSLFHVPRQDHAQLFSKFHRWLAPEGSVLFTYATAEYTGEAAFDGYKEFLGQQLYYSHNSTEKLYTDLQQNGFAVEARDYREIGNEVFLWVTARRIAIAAESEA
jgi:cyclopropane fatty-acyl-phospholipid synthase-like methyltransferase